MARGDEVPIWLRPESAGVGRPAERSRAEVTDAALAIADEAGLAAVSMRRVAARLGTGAGSLYRYVSTRDDLLDLMIDATAAEYRLAEPTGDPATDLVRVAEQARATMLRHPWLPELVIARPTLGPHAAQVLEHVLTVLADEPLGARAKLELFALLMALAAQFARHEAAGNAAASASQQAYLAHLAASGEFPRIAALLSDAVHQADAEPAPDPFAAVLPRLLAGYLEH